MRRFCASRLSASLAIAAVAVFGGLASPAHAVPPTVTPSPGYDARLQEQRAAQATHEPVARYSRPAHRRHVRQTHGAH